MCIDVVLDVMFLKTFIGCIMYMLMTCFSSLSLSVVYKIFNLIQFNSFISGGMVHIKKNQTSDRQTKKLTLRNNKSNNNTKEKMLQFSNKRK